jgi:hypothetical protein
MSHSRKFFGKGLKISITSDQICKLIEANPKFYKSAPDPTNIMLSGFEYKEKSAKKVTDKYKKTEEKKEQEIATEKMKHVEKEFVYQEKSDIANAYVIYPATVKNNLGKLFVYQYPTIEMMSETNQIIPGVKTIFIEVDQHARISLYDAQSEEVKTKVPGKQLTSDYWLDRITKIIDPKNTYLAEPSSPQPASSILYS